VRDYGKVHSSFWSSQSVRDMDDDARMLALYLLTCPHANMAGAFRLPLAYAAEDTGWVSERLSNGFKTLSELGWIHRDERTGWTFITNWPKWNRPDNPNQRKAIQKLVDQIPDSVSFKSIVLTAWGFSGTVSEPLGNLPSPVPVPSLSPEGEPERKPAKSKPRPTKTALPIDFGVSERVKAWAERKGFDRLADHLEAFRRKASMNGYAYADWDDAFMEAIREDWAGVRGPRNGRGQPQQIGGSRAAGRPL
jgi:hypothetical protein